jgi:hypothetical protein
MLLNAIFQIFIKIGISILVFLNAFQCFYHIFPKIISIRGEETSFKRMQKTVQYNICFVLSNSATVMVAKKGTNEP